LGLIALASAASLLLASGAEAASFTPPQVDTGQVAAISGSSAQVQNATTGETTVNWTSTTTFSQRQTVSLSTIAVGDCVTVIGTAGKKTKTKVKAVSVTISHPTSGSCTSTTGRGGFGGGVFGGGFGGGGFAARGTTGGPPGGGFGGRGFGGGAGARRFASLANLGFASGKVLSVSSSGFVVSSIVLPTAVTKSTKAKKSTAKKTKPAKLKTEKVSVTSGSTTTFTQTVSTTASAMAVGDCVTAVGPTGTTGSVTAASIVITSTGAQTCTAGFGGFRGPGGGGAGVGA
jgi:hypothetical protein